MTFPLRSVTKNKILGELPDPVPFLGRLTINFLTNQTL